MAIILLSDRIEMMKHLFKKGYKMSQETKDKIRAWRLSNPVSEYQLQRMRESHVNGMEGKKHSPETREKMRKAALGRVISEEQRNKIRGEKNWNWKGGVTTEDRKQRNSRQFKELRKEVFYRDNYKCVLCSYPSKGTRPPDIHLDHVKAWALYPELRFDSTNCRTLCVPCHKKTDNYGFKTKRL